MPISLGIPAPITRRRALELAGLAALGGCAPRVGSSGRAQGWYALLSDPHIAEDLSASLRGEVMADNLRVAVAQILGADDPPRGVMVNGDLALERGLGGDYSSFLRICQPLRDAALPLHLAMGNHDDRANLLAALSPGPERESAHVHQKMTAIVEGSELRFVVLDSQEGVNVTSGQLGPEQRRWLADDLDAHPQTPTVVMVHHHLDAIARPALRDTAALLDLIRPRRQVKMVIYGHTHMWEIRTVDGVVWMNLPALGYRFQKREPLGWVILRPRAGGAEVQLVCVGGDRTSNGQRRSLTWRGA